MKNLLVLGILLAAFHTSQSAPAFCQLKSDPGQGLNFTFAVYYDAVEDRCNPFFYQGSGGNQNRFASEKVCIRTCSPNANDIYPVDESSACHFKYVAGGCNGNFLRFYYDSVHDKCKKFIWTGCHGNGNRFTDAESCNNTCAGIHDDREEAEEEEPDTPIAIICGVLLAVIIVAVLITVIVLTVKSKKKKSSKKELKKSNEPQAESPLQEAAIEMK